MPGKRRRAGAIESRTSQLSVTRFPVAVANASCKASRLLNTAAATLAAGVLMDSTAEHYRAGFHNRVMFVAPAVSAAALTSAAVAAFTPYGGRGLPRSVFAMSMLTGLIGFGFHVTNASRRLGAWRAENVFHGAPIAAPLAITMAGVLGIAASRVTTRRLSCDPPAESARRGYGGASVALGTLSAAALVGTSLEAGALHFRGAFQSPFMYAPVTIPPLAAAALGTAALTGSSKACGAARALLRLTTWLGIAGMGFHAWGVHRRMGGWSNWRQNLLAGPPLPAPPAFTGLALAGLAALELLEAERAE
jgi:hypothetical protein